MMTEHTDGRYNIRDFKNNEYSLGTYYQNNRLIQAKGSDYKSYLTKIWPKSIYKK